MITGSGGEWWKIEDDEAALRLHRHRELSGGIGR